MKKWTTRQVLKVVNSYVVFFLVVAFAVTCCMMLFVSTLADSMGIVFTSDNITAAAKLTFGNVVLITILFGTSDFIRRKITVDRPVKRIIKAAEKIMQGDFSARVAPLRGAGVDGFNQIGIAINKMAEELSGTETLRTDFIANVSHEMKTPLAVMQNYGTLLQQPELDEKTRIEYAKSVSESARRLADLVSNILKLNKLENQQIFPEARSFDLGEQLIECILGYETAWEEKELELECDIQEQVLVEADPELLQLVWNNLLSNAVKFTPQGGKIAVTMKLEGNWASVSVADTGCGMTKETGARIFEKFYQGDTAHATRGNGLGLALVKRVVDITGGVISVTSAPGKGSTFTVRLGRAKDGAD